MPTNEIPQIGDKTWEEARSMLDLLFGTFANSLVVVVRSVEQLNTHIATSDREHTERIEKLNDRMAQTDRDRSEWHGKTKVIGALLMFAGSVIGGIIVTIVRHYVK